MRVALVAVLLAAFSLTGCLKGTPFAGGNDSPGPRDYVSARDYTKWVIEYDIVEGMDPPAAALTLLEDRLEEVVNKPDGVEIRRGETLPRTNRVWEQEAVLDTSRRTQTLDTGGNTVVLHLLFLDGEYENRNVLGATYFQTRGGDVVSSGPIAIFSDRIHDTACPPPLGLCVNEAPIWQAVLIHEFGHAMGLVNSGAPMQRDHEDDGHPGHSTNRNSVMYYAVETIDVVNVFQGGPPTTFDADDKADLCALSNKC